jgi:hypothetical protein
MLCNCIHPTEWVHPNTYLDDMGRKLVQDRLHRVRLGVPEHRWNRRWDRIPTEHLKSRSQIPWERYGPLFHDACDYCELESSQISNEKLCHGSLHLRVRHILICAPIWKNISLGTVSDIAQRDSCSFCRLVTRSIERYWSVAGLGNSRDLEEAVCFLKCVEIISTAPYIRLSFKLGPKLNSRKLEETLLIRFYNLWPYVRKASSPFTNLSQYMYPDDRLQSPALELPGWGGTNWQAEEPSHTSYTAWDGQPDLMPDLMHPSKKEVYINGITPRPHPQRDSLLMHIVRRKVNWVLVQGVLQQCQSVHEGFSGSCQSVIAPLRRPLRVIDVVQRSVVQTPPNCEYLTLSYVWGTAYHQKMRALKSNISELGHRGALSSPRLPKTIEDAIQACVYMIQQYLWVDALCILQDDPEEKNSEILAMGDIYSGAILTIVASSGLHADSGLPGVSSVPRLEQFGAYLGGVELIELLPGIQSTVDCSVWNTRGWTFQERLLSKRCLYFTPSQVFFRCSKGLWSEDPCRDTSDGFGKYTPFQPLNLKTLEHPLREFAGRACDYNMRDLSNDSDALNAFNGTSNTLSRRPGRESGYLLAFR